MSNKFETKFKNKFDELRNKLKDKREEAEKKSSGATFDDSWKFKPSLPANKPKVTYTVRILPNVHSESIEPWVKANFHMFRRPDGKFIYTLCPSTFEEDASKVKCPICEKSKKLFSTNDAMDEKQARDLWRKPRYFANVLIKKDPRSGEDSQEGQVLVWEFGNQIFEKLVDALTEDEINFHHPFEGVDFNLILKKKADFTNYESSHFASDQSQIAEDEEKLNEIFDSIYNLDEKILGRGAKDYDKLVEMLTGEESESPKKKPTTRDSDEDEGEEEEDEEESVDTEEEDEEKDSKKDSKKSDDDDDDFDFDFDDD